MLNEGLGRIYVTPIVAIGPAVAIVLGALASRCSARRSPRSRPDSRRRGGRREPARRRHPSQPTGRRRAARRRDGGRARRREPDRLVPGRLRPCARRCRSSVRAGEIVGIVGESGSGKTLTAMAIADLLPPNARMTAARLRVCGRDPRDLTEAERRKLLGRSLAIVYQDPMSSLNPALRVGRPARRGGRGALRALAGAGAAAKHRPPALRPDRQPGGARTPVPARVLRRDAPARGDRHGADDRAEADRSPTSRRPRSTSPCSSRSCGCSATSARRAARPRSSSRTTSPWSRRSAAASSSCTRAASSRSSTSATLASGPGPPVHRGAGRLGPDDGVGSLPAARHHPRTGAGPVRPVARLPVRHALSIAYRALPRRDAAARPAGARAPRRMLAPAHVLASARARRTAGRARRDGARGPRR